MNELRFFDFNVSMCTKHLCKKYPLCIFLQFHTMSREVYLSVTITFQQTFLAAGKVMTSKRCRLNNCNSTRATKSSKVKIYSRAFICQQLQVKFISCGYLLHVVTLFIVNCQENVPVNPKKSCTMLICKSYLIP